MKCNICKWYRNLNKWEGVCNYLTEFNDSVVLVPKDIVCSGFNRVEGGQRRRKQRVKKHG